MNENLPWAAFWLALAACFCTVAAFYSLESMLEAWLKFKREEREDGEPGEEE